MKKKYRYLISYIIIIVIVFFCLDVPESPVNLTAIEINSRNITLVWVEPHENNAPILRYRVYYITPSFLGAKDVSVETMDDSETLTILNLHPGEEYEFTVTAINEEGESENSTSLTVGTEEEGNA